ncbi:hypothetical protein AAL_07711 [Moelleriella libera RCEF 2490]|uniref:Uncharacterized protein n=1 Tax=Moelleriella libera RCEF 2490 TaxID=1081109 RepID=A0A167WY54_9HYPO|nr:hypothetical protein AAL_07711 [Moelleriella libera RCEF 2490]
MVSFFGLKLGSDKKKSQYAPPTEPIVLPRDLACLRLTNRKSFRAKTHSKAPLRPLEPHHVDPSALGEGQFYGHNFSRPQMPASTARPGTANSFRHTGNWRAVFQNPAMTSSMVDLAPPQRRQPSMSSLRHAASDLNLKPDVPLPPVFGGSGPLPGNPGRPASSRKSEWINPLAVHFCKYPAGNGLEPNGAIAAASAAPSAVPHTGNYLGRTDFDQGVRGHAGSMNAPPMQGQRSDETSVTKHGYPSPPQSDKNSERTLSPVNVPISEPLASHGHRVVTSLPKKADVRGPAVLPSPASSSHEGSEDRTEAPIIRNVPARRDTLAFHQPRGRSLTMEFENPHQATMMHLPGEAGFSGNFLDFDFGDFDAKSSSKPASGQTRSRATTEDDRMPSPPLDFFETSRALKATVISSPTPVIVSTGYSPKRVAREQSRSPAATKQAVDDEAVSSALIDQMPIPPRNSSRGPPPPPAPITSATAMSPSQNLLDSFPNISPRQGFQSRFDSGTSSRAPPPRPLRGLAPISLASPVTDVSPKSPYGPPPDSGGSYMRDGDLSSRPSQTPSASPFSKPIEGDFPLSKGLPRGRRPGPPPPPPPADETVVDDEALLPSWADFDRFESRKSAIPAPLTSARPSTASHGTESSLSTPTSATAPPRLPSQTFSSLLQSISSSGSSFGDPFEIDFEGVLNSPTFGGLLSLDSPPPAVAAAAAGTSSAVRVEAVRAPPRPSPPTPTLAPSTGREDGAPSLRPPAVSGLSATFI